MDKIQDSKEFRSFSQSVDFGKTASDYRKYRAGFPDQFFERICAQFDLRPGMSALDLGTGTGTVARGLAQLGLKVTALDPSTALMDQASAMDREAGVSIDYIEGKAEALPFKAGSYDLVTAGQCWHWFDRPQAAGEVMRVLKPGGLLIIAHFDWIHVPGNMLAATEAMILDVNPAWKPMSGGSGVHPQWLTDMAAVGFLSLETASFDLDQPYSHEAWIGRIKASAGIKASLDEQATEEFAARLAAMLKADFPEDPLAVPHRVWWASGRKTTA
ncbi:MAG: methyltransferase domain-containing protein [Novosphingobium sp.]|nr:methyltransferase domain-containing protein [Novosphingobium sp.]